MRPAAKPAAIDAPDEREAGIRRVDALHARGEAANMASVPEMDDVIDPAKTRCWIVRGRRTVPAPPFRQRKTLPRVETW